jgi:acylaminoacyl-peptidase
MAGRSPTTARALPSKNKSGSPMSGSEQDYQALKLLGVESVLVRVPGDPPGIRRRPSHWVSKVLHIQGWFDQHRADRPEAK